MIAVMVQLKLHLTTLLFSVFLAWVIKSFCSSELLGFFSPDLYFDWQEARLSFQTTRT